MKKSFLHLTHVGLSGMIIKVIRELAIVDEAELQLAVVMCTTAKNKTLRQCGWAPLQVLQGRDALVPESIMQQISDGEVKFKINEDITQDEATKRREMIRAAASQAFIWMDSHEALRKGLNARSRPPKLVGLYPGAQVYFMLSSPARRALGRRMQDRADT